MFTYSYIPLCAKTTINWACLPDNHDWNYQSAKLQLRQVSTTDWYDNKMLSHGMGVSGELQ